jgi:transposase InsO family protein
LTYGLIGELSAHFPVRRLCEVLGVSRSAYYDHLGRSFSRIANEKAALAKELERIFYLHKRRYGSRRLHSVLQDEGKQVGRHRVRSMMKALSLKAIQPRSFVPRTTRADATKARSPNLLLEMNGPPSGVNQVVVGDITYLASETGWLYLCTWMDLFSRRITGWQVDDHMQARLVIEAFKKVVEGRCPPPGLIVHSDGGAQYTTLAFRKMLEKQKCRQSMTRKDNHYDNAFAESLFSRIKAELMDAYPVFKDKQDARLRIFEYIEGYYNTHRKHSALGYRSPIQFERKADNK